VPRKLLITSGEKDHTVPWAIANASYQQQQGNQGVTEIVEIKNRGHALTIDSGWREVADTALAFVKRFTQTINSKGCGDGGGRCRSYEVQDRERPGEDRVPGSTGRSATHPLVALMLRPCVEPARSRPVPSRRSWSVAGRGCLLGRRARQRSGVQILDLVGAFGELPAVRGASVAVVVHGVVQMRAAVAHVPETQDVCTAGRGVARKLDCARVRGLHEVVPQTLP
jgi:hypothetical protein